MYHLGATIQSAADVFSLLVGLSEDSSHCQLCLGIVSLRNFLVQGILLWTAHIQS